MKVVTLWQPWASLIAFGVKTIETRSWPTSHRGRLAIHAAKTTSAMEDVMLGRACREEDAAICTALAAAGVRTMAELPLGAIVATAELVDCVPMVDVNATTNRAAHLIVGTRHDPDRLLLCRPGVGHYGPGANSGEMFEWKTEVVTDQSPFGDFRPGRWAWLLEDVQPLPEPVPFRGAQGLTREWTP